jgi:hypothetical protein
MRRLNVNPNAGRTPAQTKGNDMESTDDGGDELAFRRATKRMRAITAVLLRRDSADDELTAADRAELRGLGLTDVDIDAIVAPPTPEEPATDLAMLIGPLQ